jgi:hypothetical protein
MSVTPTATHKLLEVGARVNSLKFRREIVQDLRGGMDAFRGGANARLLVALLTGIICQIISTETVTIESYITNLSES